MIRFGVLKLARFSRLKISARNCRFRFSRMCVSFMTEKSHVASPGPMNVSLPKFPKNPLLLGKRDDSRGLNHSLAAAGIAAPVKLGLRKGRTGLRVSPSFEGL